MGLLLQHFIEIRKLGDEYRIYSYPDKNFSMAAVRDSPVPQCFITNTKAEYTATKIIATFICVSHSSQCRSSERARQLSLESDWKVLDRLDCLEVLDETGSNISKNTGAAILNWILSLLSHLHIVIKVNCSSYFIGQFLKHSWINLYLGKTIYTIQVHNVSCIRQMCDKLYVKVCKLFITSWVSFIQWTHHPQRFNIIYHCIFLRQTRNDIIM